MPDAITRPMEKRDTAPAPVAVMSGMTPSTIAAVVMRIGRRRMPAAISMASRLDFPACCFRLPTACSFGCQSDRATLVVDTVFGRLPMLVMKAFTWPSSKILKPKLPASTTPTTTNMMIIRLIIALHPLLAAAWQLDVPHRRQIEHARCALRCRIDVGAIPPAAAQRLEQRGRVAVALRLRLYPVDQRVLVGLLGVEQREVIDRAGLVLLLHEPKVRSGDLLGGNG